MIDDIDDGDVVASSKSAKRNATVTLTVTADEGYELDELTVTDSKGNEITVKEKSNGKYTFTMPSSKVTVEATFVAEKQDDDIEITFGDVDGKAYYADAVKWAVENDVTTGLTATSFGPDAVCTRAQVVTFLWRAASEPEPKSVAMPFTDVAANAYYYDAVLWAVENGITNGTSADTFGPDADCTRGQIVTFLWRCLAE
ncbi:MAG: S-layer homology domain-containing protein [Firmicutes bacterium]|nr:S-layer homology domain-containing protein [Bacillota bacterium]